MDNRTCKNCQTELTGKYCSECGQRDISSGITIKETLLDFLSTNFSIEGPIWLTLKLLVINPGQLFRDFIEGKRKSYYKPIQFLIVITVVYLAVVGLLDHDPLKGQFISNPQYSVNEQVVTGISEQATRIMLSNINSFILVLAFSFAVVAKVFRWKRNSFAEYLSIGFYITGIYILFGAFNVVLIELGLSTKYLQFPLLWIYMTYAYISFVGGFTVLRLLKGFCIALISWFGYMVSAFGIAFVIAYLTI